MVTADELFGLSKLSELQSPGSSSEKATTRAGAFSRRVNL